MFRPMFQAHAQQLLNQKESQNDHVGRDTAPDALFEATERLMGALDRLDYNVQARAAERAQFADQQGQVTVYARENEALKRERDGLSVTIGKLEQDYGELQKAAGTIYKKLNDSIKRLTNIIGD